MRNLSWTLLSVVGLVACGGGDGEGSHPATQVQAVWPDEGASGEMSAPFVRPAAGVRDEGPLQIKSRPRLVSPVPLSLSLPPLPEAKAQLQQPGVGQAQRVGVARELPTSHSKTWPMQLNWQRTAYGSHVAALQVTSTGAKGVRLGVLVDALPGSARFRVYAPNAPEDAHEVSGHQVLQLLALNRDAGDASDDGRTWWTPQVAGEAVVLELELPRGTPVSAVAWSVPSLSHIYTDDVALDLSTKNGEAAACHVDAVCRSETSDVADAVARMVFVKSGDAYLCSGTMVNDKDPSSYAPYFISAAHCLSTQTQASTLQTDWFYRSAACNSSATAATKRTLTGGAQMLYTNTGLDVSFMRLNDAALPGTAFVGWTTQVTQGINVMGVHHPKGDRLKASFGNLQGQANCSVSTDGGFSCSGSSGDYHRVRWSSGITEGGSSGSGLFNSSGQIMGVLRGGNSTCTATGFGFYGRFDKAFQAGVDKWLTSTGSEPAPNPTPPVVTPPPNPSPAAPRSAVYRFYNPQSGAHFYSGSAAERDFVIRALPAFQYEGVAFYAASQAGSGLEPVYRFYNSRTAAHFYSISQAERDFVIGALPEFAYEGPSWYARASAGSGSVPVYRFYNASSGAHFYTSNAAERDFVINTLREFQYESVAYHVWTAP